MIHRARGDEYSRFQTRKHVVTTDDIDPEIAALLALLAEQASPHDSVSVLDAALAARPAAPLQPAPIDDEVAAFARAVADVASTLGLLTAQDWGRPAVNGLTVGELAGHLIGTQQEMAAEFGLETAGSGSRDHIESTREAITAGALLSPTEAAEQFSLVSARLITHLTGLDDDGLSAGSRFGPIDADVRFLLLVRVFELWTHDNDLRRAVGLPRVDPDADRLWMMTRAAMPVVRRIGDERIRIVLTGAGGGVWPAQGDEIAEIVVDSVAFCRRVANRMPMEDLVADVSGDGTIATETLTALAGLALD